MSTDWRAIALDDLVRLGVLLPGPGQPRLRRILRVPHPDRAPPPPRPMMWTGDRGRELTVPVFDARRRLLSYCARGDGWASDPRLVYG